MDHTAPDGTVHTYQLAERLIDLPVSGRHATTSKDATAASTLTLRLIVRRNPDGHQTPILTNRTDLTAPQIAYRMAARWRQENYLKYAREHFALDALDSYADHPDDLTRLVPNPAKARAADHVTGACAQLVAAHADMADAIGAAATNAGRPGSGGKATVDPTAGQALSVAQGDLADAKQRPAPPPATYPSGRYGPAVGYSKPNANS